MLGGKGPYWPKKRRNGIVDDFSLHERANGDAHEFFVRNFRGSILSAPSTASVPTLQQEEKYLKKPTSYRFGRFQLRTTKLASVKSKFSLCYAKLRGGEKVI